MKLSEDGHKEALALSYQQLNVSLLAIVLNGFFIGVLLWDIPQRPLLVGWIVLLFAISLWRLGLYLEYRKDPQRRSVRMWERLFLVGVVLSGLMWGSAGFLLFDAEDPLHQAVLIVVLSGMSAGSISSLAAHLKAVRIFIVLAMTPLLLRLMLEAQGYYWVLSFFVALFILMLLVMARRIYRTYVDLTETRRLYERERKELHLSQERSSTMVSQAPVGIFFYDPSLRIVEVNAELCTILGTPESYLIGLPLLKLSDQRVVPVIIKAIDGEEGNYEGEYQTQYLNRQLFIHLRTAPLLDLERQVIGGIGIVNDVTERFEFIRQIEYQARHDTLTDTPNRTMLIERINQEMVRFFRERILFGVLFLDLDNFKTINDSLGHTVGDALLCEVALRLKHTLDERDMLARIGGDEFVIVLPHLGRNRHDALERMERAAQSIHAAFGEDVEIDGRFLSVSTSIGMVLMHESEERVDDLLKHADTAMYQAKRDGKGMSRLYQEQMDFRIRRLMVIENALRPAIKQGALQLYYQPIIEIATGEIVAAEALLRWNHSELGFIAPLEMIAVAEESGLIVELGRWVLEEAIRQFMQWRGQTPIRRIAVNVSSKQFGSPDFVSDVFMLLERYAMPSGALELELTESVVISDVDEVAAKMHALREHGVGLSIDDFGTGYSSLSYLKKLPFSTLKIDRSFTQDLVIDEDDRELVSTIITIAENFGLEVVAEGVEQHDQLDFLRQRSCEYYQGYLCSRPLEVQDFERLMAHHRGVCGGHS
ncbi:MAG: EAL domain-containing protein [Campylobacterales bacterium]|nr:EAL domain-containing protein [Campylobacterales bacterium]